MSHVLSWMQPRDHRAAARTVPVLGGVAITVTLLFLPMTESNGAVDTPLIAVATARLRRGRGPVRAGVVVRRGQHARLGGRPAAVRRRSSSSSTSPPTTRR